MHSISNVQPQQQRMRVIRFRSPESQMCRLSCSLSEKPASKSSAKIKRRKIVKLKPATTKPAAPKGNRPEHSGSKLAETLLLDVLAIFKSKKATKIRTQEILDALVKKKPWASICRGKRITARRLAALLKPYGISSRDLRFDTGAYKGFKKEWFLARTK